MADNARAYMIVRDDHPTFVPTGVTGPTCDYETLTTGAASGRTHEPSKDATPGNSFDDVRTVDVTLPGG